MFLFYSLAGWLLILSGLPFYLLYCIITGKELASLGQRFGLSGLGHLAWRHSTHIWIHAASVGEIQVAKALIAQLLKANIQTDIVVTTVTEQGQIIASQQLPKQIICLYAPLDLPWVVNKFILAIQPTIYVCLETELWPNMLRLLPKHGIKSLLLNGRMSDRSYRRYKYISGFMKQVIGSLSAAATIDVKDLEKYANLGLERNKIHVCGNAKYDLGQGTANPQSTSSNNSARDTEHILKLIKNNKNQIILVAGSTHSGEEEELINVHQKIKHRANLITIIAPRHINRLPLIETIFRQRDVRYQKLSEITNSDNLPEIILVDYMGALVDLYGIADFAFCGGSLVDYGGHNIMEPAVCGLSPFYGTYMSDFADIARFFTDSQAGFSVKSGADLAEKIIYFIGHKSAYKQACKRAENLARQQQGAASRQVKLILQALQD